MVGKKVWDFPDLFLWCFLILSANLEIGKGFEVMNEPFQQTYPSKTTLIFSCSAKTSKIKSKYVVPLPCSSVSNFC